MTISTNIEQAARECEQAFEQVTRTTVAGHAQFQLDDCFERAGRVFLRSIESDLFPEFPAERWPHRQVTNHDEWCKAAKNNGKTPKLETRALSLAEADSEFRKHERRAWWQQWAFPWLARLEPDRFPESAAYLHRLTSEQPALATTEPSGTYIVSDKWTDSDWLGYAQVVAGAHATACRLIVDRAEANKVRRSATYQKLNATARQAYDWIAENPGSGQKEIAKAVSVSYDHFRSDIIPQLRQAGVKNNGGEFAPNN